MTGASAAEPAAPAGEPRPWGRAALWLVVLVPVFFATYGAANWLASRRPAVGAVVFGWEREVPFLPWTIVPYWSIDLFYGLSLFVCATRAELDTQARRLLTAQLVAVACFILFPLRFTFTRPPMTGVAGFLFDTLAGFDKPFNQAPSLHIALLVILWVLYARHVPRRALGLLHGWLTLVGLSPVRDGVSVGRPPSRREIRRVRPRIVVDEAARAAIAAAAAGAARGPRP